MTTTREENYTGKRNSANVVQQKKVVVGELVNTTFSEKELPVHKQPKETMKQKTEFKKRNQVILDFFFCSFYNLKVY